jgi:acylphosphatase
MHESSQSADSTCLRCTYHGRVQGVGFRATTASIAARYRVAGYVRNQPDGTVELVVIGNPAVIAEFRSELQRQMARGIIRIEEEPAERPPGCTGFQIRYS